MNEKMMNTTPGPWRIDADDPYEVVSVNYGGIARVPNEPAENRTIMAEMRANARLIAAAPRFAGRGQSLRKSQYAG